MAIKISGCVGCGMADRGWLTGGGGLKIKEITVSTCQLRFPEALRFPEGAFFNGCSIAWNGGGLDAI
jgi:hypothetical protein